MPMPRQLTSTSVRRYAGGWAVITGAARVEGLGYAFARQVAAEGVNLVLVDIEGDALAERAEELRRQHRVQVRVAVCDLATAGPWQGLEAAVADAQVDLLVCNHMFTPRDTPPVLDMPLEVHHRMIDINARAYTTLIHRFAGLMRQRGRGAVVIVSSGAGLTSAPFTAAYSANKAFQIALGEALWFELRGTGVDVIVMIGGLMNTQGSALNEFPAWLVAQPDPVVREVLSAIGKKHLVIPGWSNRLFTLAQTRLSSRRRTVTSIGRFMAKGLSK